jgi:hypothetical protein
LDPHIISHPPAIAVAKECGTDASTRVRSREDPHRAVMGGFAMLWMKNHE